MSESTNPSPEDRVKYRDRAKEHAKTADRELESADASYSAGDWETGNASVTLASAHALVSIAYSQMAPPMRVRPQHCASPRIATR